MDLVIVMQDWDFPHFTNTLDVNLPGFYKHMVHFQALEIQISGKWFNYGLIFFVMIFDLNMWKNQIFYKPEYYGQYVGTLNSLFRTGGPQMSDAVFCLNSFQQWTTEFTP